MAKQRRIIPFALLPYSWGIKGKTREISKAEYELEGETLERKLADINTETKEELNLKLLDISRKYKHLTKEEYDYELAKAKYGDTKEHAIAHLELDKKYGKISETECEKELATLNEEPWIGVLGSEYHPGQASDGFSFELDWNDIFVQMLIAEGYAGGTDEEIVEQWFEDKSTEQYLGLISEELSNMDEVHDLPRTKTSHEALKDGKTKHS